MLFGNDLERGESVRGDNGDCDLLRAIKEPVLARRRNEFKLKLVKSSFFSFFFLFGFTIFTWKYVT